MFFVRECSGDRTGAGTGATAAAAAFSAEEESAEAGSAAGESFRAGIGIVSGCFSVGRRTIDAGGAGARDSNCMLRSSFPSAKSLSAITLLCSVNHLKSRDRIWVRWVIMLIHKLKNKNVFTVQRSCPGRKRQEPR